MRVIKDIKGREWKLQITVATAKRVNSDLKLNLFDIGDSGFIQTIVDDPVKLLELFWVFFKDQAKEMEVDEMEFCEGFAGDQIADATMIFLDELTDFFPPSKRVPAKKLLAKIQKLAAMAFKKVEEEVDNLDDQKVLDTVMDHMKQKTNT